MKTKPSMFNGGRFFLVLIIMIGACTVPRQMAQKPPNDLGSYTFFYLHPSYNLSSNFVSTASSNFSIDQSINRMELIKNLLVEKGFTFLPQRKAALAQKTFMVNLSEGVGMDGNTNYVTVQFTNAQTNQLICSGSVVGQGPTTRDDIQLAILRCLEKYLPYVISNTPNP